MKTNFFGLSAKLALAIMAVSGTLFTSCYDSVDGDVTVPYTPKAEYVITGTVVDASTSSPISNASISGDGITTTTDAAGSFRVTAPTPKTYSLTITATGYNNVTRPVVIAAATPGVGGINMYVVNVAMNSTTTSITNVTTTTQTNAITPSNVTITAQQEATLDLVNDTNVPKTFKKTFKVPTGSKLVSETTGSGDDFQSLKTYGVAYVKTQVGDYTAGITNMAREFDIVVPPLSSVLSVTLTTNVIKETFTFKRDFTRAIVTETYASTTERVSNWGLVPNTVPNSVYHGHGHGNTNNAGGGIVTPEI